MDEVKKICLEASLKHAEPGVDASGLIFGDELEPKHGKVSPKKIR